MWRNFRAEDLATPGAFAQDPRLVWEWYNWRRELIATKRPNAAHETVAEMERHHPQFWLITQNVDGLHRAAGSRKLSEIHGNIWMVRCTGCQRVVENRAVPIQILPKCADCHSLLRPHIVWFGESLDPVAIGRTFAESAAADSIGTNADGYQVVPTQNTKKVTVSREMITHAVRRVSILSKEKTNAVKLQLEKNRLILSTSNPEVGEANEELTVDYKGEALAIGFNSRYLMDVLTAMDKETIRLELNDPLSPCLIMEEGDENYKCVVMPMRV